VSDYQQDTEKLYRFGFSLEYDAEDAAENPKDYDPDSEVWRLGDAYFTRGEALNYIYAKYRV
jgi:hypothetical protein